MELSSCSLVFSAYHFAAGLGSVCGLDARGGAAGKSLQKAMIMEGTNSGDMITVRVRYSCLSRVVFAMLCAWISV